MRLEQLDEMTRSRDDQWARASELERKSFGDENIIRLAQSKLVARTRERDDAIELLRVQPDVVDGD